MEFSRAIAAAEKKYIQPAFHLGSGRYRDAIFLVKFTYLLGGASVVVAHEINNC